MKRLNVLFALLIAIQISTPAASGQWRWTGSLEVGMHQNQNIFKSPARLLSGAQLLNVDSLYHNDLVIPIDADLDLRYQKGRHDIRLDYAANLDRYNKFDNLNGGYHMVRLSDRWDAARSVFLYAEAEGRTVKRVGTNVLGDELSRLFEYNQAGAAVDLTLALNARQALVLGYNGHYRDYRESEGASSLDSYSHEGSLEWIHRTPEKDDAFWETSLEAAYRSKKYISYLARDADGRQNDGYPENHLDYYDLTLRLERAFSRAWTWTFEAGGRYRDDRFEDYYNYLSVDAETGIEWEITRTLEIHAEAGVRHMVHEIKDAPQSGSLIYPTLEYDYFDWQVELDYDVLDAVSMLFFVESDNRYSNVTLESYRVRRSYDTLRGGFSVTFDLDRMISR